MIKSSSNNKKIKLLTKILNIVNVKSIGLV
jgi:hypothetical protein